eukprot:TRINITY_DN26549_c0_g1_i1.p1 TRINITY_DN26549_c0_g1~~TRINITY_DN26549_c0_g1_i1.p1  ORF type:complete len:292 (+),score=34.72 TRINITY_DN26549_c0_g1_i1:43-876(+)
MSSSVVASSALSLGPSLRATVTSPAVAIVCSRTSFLGVSSILKRSAICERIIAPGSARGLSFSTNSFEIAGVKMPSWFPSFGTRASMATADETSSPAKGPDDDVPTAGLQFATFGAGCFWGIELVYQRVPGVVKTAVGYTQGSVHNPSYNDVCSGRTGHTEAVRVEYNPNEVSYETLLEVLFTKIDPTQKNGQGNDRGTQYRSGIYYYTPEQKEVAEAFLAKEQAKLGSRKIATELLPATKWYPAESYHQQYLAKGGRFGMRQSTEKNCKDPIRCYG